MATKPLSDFLPQVLPSVLHCPQLLARNAVLEAAIEFCERTWVDQYDVPAISSIALTPSYVLAPRTNTEIVEVIDVRYDGKHIDPTSRAELDLANPDIEWQAETGEVKAYIVDPPYSTIRLVDAPADAITDGLKVRVALRPTHTATAVEDLLYFKHLQAIAAGAKAILYGMPDKPWTRVARQKEERDNFDTAVGTASVHRAKGFSRMPQRTTSYYDIG